MADGVSQPHAGTYLYRGPGIEVWLACVTQAREVDDDMRSFEASSLVTSLVTRAAEGRREFQPPNKHPQRCVEELDYIKASLSNVPLRNICHMGGYTDDPSLQDNVRSFVASSPLEYDYQDGTNTTWNVTHG